MWKKFGLDEVDSFFLSDHFFFFFFFFFGEAMPLDCALPGQNYIVVASPWITVKVCYFTVLFEV